jgi:MFS family permease
MTEDSLSILFRVCAGLFFVSLAIFLYQSFTKKEKRNKRLKLVSGIATFLLVAVVLGIILYTANSDVHIQAIKATKNVSERAVERAKQNVVFQDVQFFTGIIVHLVIISVIGVAYLLLWKRAARLPQNNYKLVHKGLLLVGMCTVIGFAIYDFSKCITDAEFREQVYLRTYTEYFVGNIFLMLVASIVAAAGMPDEPESGQSASSS